MKKYVLQIVRQTELGVGVVQAAHADGYGRRSLGRAFVADQQHLQAGIQFQGAVLASKYRNCENENFAGVR